jgi:hypothetical protein
VGPTPPDQLPWAGPSLCVARGPRFGWQDSRQLSQYSTCNEKTRGCFAYFIDGPAEGAGKLRAEIRPGVIGPDNKASASSL